MHPAPTHLNLPEASARRLLLASAIETVDTTGRLVGSAERDQLEQAALGATGDPARGEALDWAAYLQARAQRLLELVGHRHPRIAAIEHPSPWAAWLPWVLPVVALALGAALDRIGNPQQVNLLSPPLLAFVFWNLAVYLMLLGGWAWQLRRANAKPPALLSRWWSAAAQRRTGNLRADIAAQFRWQWWQAAGTLEVVRWKAVLHASAAAWALGVALSIALGGLVREYRVGWESTFLDLPQVHAFLRLVFAPVVAVLPLEPFTIGELERMHFRSGSEVGRVEARRWVGLYLGLLGLVVMLPRVLLAAQSVLNRLRLARRVRVDLQDSYHQQVLGRVSPATVLLCLVPGPPAATLVLHQVVRSLTERWPPGPDGASVVLATMRGDELGWMELPVAATPPAAAPAAVAGWRGLLRHWSPAPAASIGGPAERARWHADVLLCPVAGSADLNAAAPMLQWLGRPVLVLPCGPALDAGSEASLRNVVQRLEAGAELLPLDQACATWRHEQALRAAIERLLAPHKAPGMVRLGQAWQARHAARLAESMRVLAEELLQAAGESQAVAAGPLDLRRLVRPADRTADAQARESAAAALRERLRERRLRAGAELMRLHAVEGAGVRDEPVRQHGVVVRQGVDTPQAGMAGAASGAALGATVDLMVGGITLGAAAALGAVLGGGAAYVAAAWKNRATVSGTTVLQLDDDILDALVADALLRYLVVAHAGRSVGLDVATPTIRWEQEVGAVVQSARDTLRPLWMQVRAAQDGPLPVAALAQRLTEMALATLDQLERPARLGATGAGVRAGG